MARSRSPTVWREAERLLARLGVSHPQDIDVEAIAEYAGAHVRYETLRGSAARLAGHGDRAIITVDRKAHPYRRRFSAAHELGHWMLDRRRSLYVCSGAMMEREWSEDNPERRANRWAAGLLMPANLFAADARGREVTFETVRDLARRYRTSLTATALRLVEWGSAPATVLCCRRDRRWKWFEHSPGIPRKLWPLPQPGPETVAYGLLRGSRDRPGPTDVPASGWIGRSDAWWYRVREHSIPVRPGEVLTLLWWREESLVEAAIFKRWLPGGAPRATKSLFLEALEVCWNYRRVRQKGGETVLEAEGPGIRRIFLPHFREFDEAVAHELVAMIAIQQGLSRDDVLRELSRIKQVKSKRYHAKLRANAKERARLEGPVDRGWDDGSEGVPW